MALCLALRSPTPRLEALCVTVSVAGAVNPSMGSVASKIQRGSTKPALLFPVQEIIFGTAAVLKVNSRLSLFWVIR